MHILWKKQSQAAVGFAWGSQFPQNILSTWFGTIFYLFFWNSKNILSIIFFWLLHFFKISPDPCPKWPKNDFKRDEKRVKHRVLKIFQLFSLFFLKILFENVRYSIYFRIPIYIYIYNIYIYRYKWEHHGISAGYRISFGIS